MHFVSVVGEEARRCKHLGLVEVRILVADFEAVAKIEEGRMGRFPALRLVLAGRSRSLLGPVACFESLAARYVSWLATRAFALLRRRVARPCRLSCMRIAPRCLCS